MHAHIRNKIAKPIHLDIHPSNKSWKHFCTILIETGSRDGYGTMDWNQIRLGRLDVQILIPIYQLGKETPKKKSEVE